MLSNRRAGLLVGTSLLALSCICLLLLAIFVKSEMRWIYAAGGAMGIAAVALYWLAATRAK
jgi:hypothetical protein